MAPVFPYYKEKRVEERPRKIFRNGEERFEERQGMGLERFSFKTCSKMANFRPIKKPGTGLEMCKDEKTGKERRRTG